jgi:hypothetical protein
MFSFPIFFHFVNISVRLCGGQTPTEPIVSTGSRMLLMYKTSEHSRPHTGFMAKYEGKRHILRYQHHQIPFSNKIKQI